MRKSKFDQVSPKTDLTNIDKFLFDNLNPVKKLLIMTIGNILMSDDGVGPMIYQELKFKLSLINGLELINAELNPENYLKKIIRLEPSHIIIIDAIQSDLTPGSIYFFGNEEIDDRLFSQPSTHMISLANINKNLLHELKSVEILNIGIQVKSAHFGINILDSSVYESAIVLRNYLTKLIMKLFKKN